MVAWLQVIDSSLPSSSWGGSPFYLFVLTFFFNVDYCWSLDWVCYNIAPVVYVLVVFFFFWPQGMWPNLPNQGFNPYPLHWKVKSYPLDHRDVPDLPFKERKSWGSKKKHQAHPNRCVWTECLLVGPWFSSVGERQLRNVQTRTPAFRFVEIRLNQSTCVKAHWTFWVKRY